MNQPVHALAPPEPAAEPDGALAAPADLLSAAAFEDGPTGAGGAVPSGPVGTGTAPPVSDAPALTADARTAPVTTNAQLDAALGAEHERVIALIRDRLPGFPEADGADVSAVLLLLDGFGLVVAASLMRVVGHDHRVRLYNHIDAGHRRRHRRSVLAALYAATAEERRALPPRFLTGMPLDELAPVERAALVDVLRGITDETFTALLTENPAVRAVMSEPSDQGVLDRERDIELEAARTRATARSAEDNALVNRLNGILAARRGDWKQDALNLLAPLAPAPAQPKQSPSDVPRSARLAAVVERIESGDRVRDLIDDLASGWSVPTLSPVTLELIRHRAPAANLAHVQRLLTRSITDWAVRDWEAWLAYQIVRRLPPADQDRWRRLDGGRWFRRMEEELPDGLRESAYEGITLEMVDGELRDVASRRAVLLRSGQAQTDFAALTAACEAGISEANASGLLLRIMSAGEATGPNGQLLLSESERAELLRAIVQGLDRRGYLSTIFRRLPDRWLFELDNLHLFRRVAELRDPAMLFRQVNDLVSHNSWRDVPIIGIFASEWSTNAHDAFVAFLLSRHLPAADRRELEATGQWAALTGALTQDMRHAAGMHLFADPGGAERGRIMDRLRDNVMWAPGHAAELRTLVRMAIELGEHRWVFDRSRETRAFTITELQPMVDAFRLYSEPGRREYVPYRLPIEEPAQDLWTVLSRAGSWLWVRLRALGRIIGSLNLGLNNVGFDDLDLSDVQDLMGGGVGPAQLSAGGNRLSASYNPRDGLLLLTMDRLEIDRLNHIGATFTARSNRIVLEGLTVAATFPAQQTRRPTALRLRMSSAMAEDLLLTTESLFLGVARSTLDSLGVDATPTGDEEPLPAPPGSDFGLPIPIFGPIISAIVNLIQRVGYVQRSLRGLGSVQGLAVTAERVQFDGIALGGSWTASTVRFSDIVLGAGLNRRAFLLRLIQVLERRLARATERGDADAVARHSARLTETRQRLARLSDRGTDDGRAWAELQDIRARFVADPSSVTGAERRRAAALEQRFTGGAVADIGSLTVSGLSGSLYVDDIVLSGLTGDVESPVFGPDTAPAASQFLTDADRVRAFRDHGPGYPGGAVAPAVLPIRAETAEVRGLSMLADEADLPTVALLRRQLAALPPNTPEERRRLLESVIEDAGDYEAARQRLRTPPPLAPEERARTELVLELARLRLRTRFGINIESIGATDAGADFLFGPGLTDLSALRFGAEGLTVRGYNQGAIHVDEITGAGVSASPERDLAPGPDGRPRRGHSVSARSVTARGVTLDWAGNQIGSVGITGLSGEVERLRDTPTGPVTAYRVTGMRATTVVVEGIDYRTSSMWVHSEGPTTLRGVLINATYAHVEGGTELRVPHLRVDEVVADHLVVENNGGEAWRATVRSGSLLGLTADDVVVRMPTMGDSEITGAFGLDALERLRFNVAAGAFSFGGTLGSARRVGTLGVRLARGRDTFDLSGLVLTEGLLGTSDGQVAIERLVLSAGAEHSGDTWTLRYLQIPTLQLGRLNWRTGDGESISSTGGVTLSGLTANGSVQTPASGPMRVRVESLVIASVTATNLHYSAPPIDINLGRAVSPAPGREPLRIETITLGGFEWTRPGGITAGTLGIASVAADFHGTLAQHLTTEATLNVSRLSATFSAGGRIVVRAGASLDADVEYHDPGATPADRRDVSAHVRVGDLDLGELSISREAVEFGAGTAPGLSIGDVTVDRATYDSPNLRIETLTGGRGAILHSLRTRLRIELRSAEERRRAGGARASAIRRIVVRDLQADSLELDGVQLTLPNLIAPDATGAHPVRIWVAPGETAFLRGLTLAIPPGGVVIDSPSTVGGSWTIPELSLSLLGTPSATGGPGLPGLLIPRLRAAIPGRLRDFEGRVTAEQIDATRFSGGGMLFSLTNPSVTQIVAAFESAGAPPSMLRLFGPATSTLPEGGLRADRATYDTRTGVATATGLNISQLSFVDPAGGLTVRVDRGVLPGTARVETASGTEVRIPRLEISGAYFEKTFPAATPTASSSTTPYGDLVNMLRTIHVNRVIENLNGRLRFDLHLPVLAAHSVPGWLLGDTIPIDLGLTAGQINYQSLQASLNTAGWAGGRLYFEVDTGNNRLKLRFDSPDIPYMTPGGIVWIPTPDIDVAHWDLWAGEIATLSAPDHLVSAWRLMEQLQGRARDRLEGALSGAATAGPPSVELQNIDGNLSVNNPNPFFLNFPRGTISGMEGWVEMAANSITGLRLHGNIPQDAGGTGLEPVSLEQAHVNRVDFTLSGGRSLTTGSITVRDASDVIFRLSRGSTAAGTFSNQLEFVGGRIRSAVAEDIVWRMP
ncbi:hypothetical protein Afil01_63180 [Actinorhabdospora filicis]|uniref:Uncharacterized protein n=1 Tax=Actinorhabdospora filicis TaxID=1785913 RepID=A0A9W6SSA3_9ACTN|nr:hypothetical protein [Actinorhabdospora filicis]GLZ81511.1 hypothetical protein Afil01_63180 [Actinorhabdospora filicis]